VQSFWSYLFIFVNILAYEAVSGVVKYFNTQGFKYYLNTVTGI